MQQCLRHVIDLDPAAAPHQSHNMRPGILRYFTWTVKMVRDYTTLLRKHDNFANKLCLLIRWYGTQWRELHLSWIFCDSNVFEPFEKWLYITLQSWTIYLLLRLDAQAGSNLWWPHKVNFSSPKPKAQGDLLWSVFVRRQSVNFCFKWHLLNHWSKFHITSHECSPWCPLSKLHKWFRSTEYEGCQSSR